MTLLEILQYGQWMRVDNPMNRRNDQYRPTQHANEEWRTQRIALPPVRIKEQDIDHHSKPQASTSDLFSKGKEKKMYTEKGQEYSSTEN